MPIYLFYHFRVPKVQRYDTQSYRKKTGETLVDHTHVAYSNHGPGISQQAATLQTVRSTIADQSAGDCLGSLRFIVRSNSKELAAAGESGARGVSTKVPLQRSCDSFPGDD